MMHLVHEDKVCKFRGASQISTTACDVTDTICKIWLCTNLCCAASFPGTKQIGGNPSLFAGIAMIFSEIPGDPSETEFLYQEKVFVARRVSGNER